MGPAGREAHTGAVKTEPIADFFDRECCAVVAERTGDEDLTADPVARLLLESIQAAGLEGAQVLELGSGDGSFSRELLRHSAAGVTGVDLSPRSVEHATTRAMAEGLGGRATYRVADAAQEPLAAHDAVVSKRVFCCYPDPCRLLANTLPSAQRAYVLALPESRGALGVMTRLVVRLANGWQWLRRYPFRGYVHDVRMISQAIEAAGFRLASSRDHRGWLVLAFTPGPDRAYFKSGRAGPVRVAGWGSGGPEMISNP